MLFTKSKFIHPANAPDPQAPIRVGSLGNNGKDDRPFELKDPGMYPKLGPIVKPKGNV